MTTTSTSTSTSEIRTSEKREVAVVEALEAAMYAMLLLQNAGIIVRGTTASLDFSKEIHKMAHALQLIAIADPEAKR